MGKDGPEWRERKIYGKRMKEKNEIITTYIDTKEESYLKKELQKQND